MGQRDESSPDLWPVQSFAFKMLRDTDHIRGKCGGQFRTPDSSGGSLFACDWVLLTILFWSEQRMPFPSWWLSTIVQENDEVMVKVKADSFRCGAPLSLQ